MVCSSLMLLSFQNKYILLLCQKTYDVVPDLRRAASDHKLSSLRTSPLIVSTNAWIMNNDE